MKRSAWLLTLAACAGTLTGCVERRYVVYTDPPGALVIRNGQTLGWSPVDDHYVYYGKYHFTIIKDGYETLQVDQEITTPWYEYFPLDFISENLNPWPVLDRREFHYKLEPRRVPNSAQLLEQAQNLRNRGLSVAPPKPAATPAAIAPAAAATPLPPPGLPAPPRP